MAARAFLFDIEGTLCDTRRWYEEILVSDFGCRRAEVRRSLESGRAPTLLAVDIGVGRERFLRACRSHSATLTVYPDVASTLRTIAERRTPRAAITNLPSVLAKAILDAASLRTVLPVVIPWQRGVPPKPHPAPLRLAMRELGIDTPEGAYYVGDSESDAEAARAAGVLFAWAAYGYTCSAPVGTSVIIRQFSQVGDL